MTKLWLILAVLGVAFFAPSSEDIVVSVKLPLTEFSSGFPVLALIHIENLSEKEVTLSRQCLKESEIIADGLTRIETSKNWLEVAKVATMKIQPKRSFDFCVILNNTFKLDKVGIYNTEVSIKVFIYTDTHANDPFAWAGHKIVFKNTINFSVSPAKDVSSLSETLVERKTLYGLALTENEATRALKSIATICPLSDLIKATRTWKNRGELISAICDRNDAELPSVLEELIFHRDFTIGNMDIKHILTKLDHQGFLNRRKLETLLENGRDTEGTLIFLEDKRETPYFPKEAVTGLLKKSRPDCEIYRRARNALSGRDLDAEETTNELRKLLRSEEGR